jgi:hypothetical protein
LLDTQVALQHHPLRLVLPAVATRKAHEHRDIAQRTLPLPYARVTSKSERAYTRARIPKREALRICHTHAVLERAQCSRRVREGDSRRVREVGSRRVRDDDSRRVREVDSRRVREVDSRRVREVDSRRVREVDSRRVREGDRTKVGVPRRLAQDAVRERHALGVRFGGRHCCALVESEI